MAAWALRIGDARREEMKPQRQPSRIQAHFPAVGAAPEYPASASNTHQAWILHFAPPRDLVVWIGLQRGAEIRNQKGESHTMAIFNTWSCNCSGAPGKTIVLAFCALVSLSLAAPPSPPAPAAPPVPPFEIPDEALAENQKKNLGRDVQATGRNLGQDAQATGRAAQISPIDACVRAALAAKKIPPAHLCSDEVFIRRAYLDVIGTLPEVAETQAFLDDPRPDKRARLIDSLLDREEFAAYWALKWCDLLRVKAEFPINLWPNAAQAYHRWIYDAIYDNMPYDQFARELLTSSGSNFRVPQVNFYRAVQSRDPAGLAAAAALTFMGTRLDKWPAAERAQIEAFFSRVAYKKTAEWKEEIVYLNPEAADPLEAVLPDGAKVRIAPDQDPREVFADWLTARGKPQPNPWFTRAIANRAWFWLMGRGVIQEPDDIRPDNPPSNPELLAVLETELVRSHYDLTQLFRLILNSRTYQQSSIPQSDNPEAEAQFAYYPVRRLEAETLLDALCDLDGRGETYSSAIPEPFTFLPSYQRTIDLADGSITSQFLEMFGRPARDTGLAAERNNEFSDAQRLHLLNSSHVQQKIERGRRLRALLQNAGGSGGGAGADLQKSLDLIYLVLLSRHPTDAEATEAQKYFQSAGKNRKQALDDLIWALVNTKEFLYRH